MPKRTGCSTTTVSPLEKIAEGLLKYEMLYAKDVDDILAGREVVREVNGAERSEEESDSADSEGRELARVGRPPMMRNCRRAGMRRTNGPLRP